MMVGMMVIWLGLPGHLLKMAMMKIWLGPLGRQVRRMLMITMLAGCRSP
jgi:hypothetical protein